MSIVCDMNDMKVVSSWNPVTVGLAQCHAHQMVILRDSETQSPKSRQRLILQHSSDTARLARYLPVESGLRIT